MKVLLLAIALGVPAMLAGDRMYIEVADREWLQSNSCTQADPEQCALELALKERLRKGSVYVGPAE